MHFKKLSSYVTLVYMLGYLFFGTITLTFYNIWTLNVRRVYTSVTSSHNLYFTYSFKSSFHARYYRPKSSFNFAKCSSCDTLIIYNKIVDMFHELLCNERRMPRTFMITLQCFYPYWIPVLIVLSMTLIHP